MPVGCPPKRGSVQKKERGYPIGVMGASGCGAPPARLWRDLDFLFYSGAAWGDHPVDHYRLYHTSCHTTTGCGALQVVVTVLSTTIGSGYPYNATDYLIANQQITQSRHPVIAPKVSLKYS